MIGGFYKVSETIESVVLSTKEYNELLEKLEEYDKELNELKQKVESFEKASEVFDVEEYYEGE